MTKTGKFSANAADVSGIAASAANKVLGILDIIIRKTVASNLEKVRETIKEIKTLRLLELMLLKLRLPNQLLINQEDKY
ncbi:Variable major protein (plasmid) [Borrelia nietonii YOR]|uniref:Variable large protein n=2 Tax=Borrelia TaxID=138 RepID=W5SH13_9SPIR|nr:Variable major protein [Borrelia nietonii YOR]AHH14801.1 Variable major protein [Borrelia hermsii MTW]